MKQLVLWSFRPLFIAATLPLLIHPTWAQTTADESVHLAVILRQLDAIEHSLNKTSAAELSRQNSRYYFDYERAKRDVARVRHGINDYLTPQRAQPRDPVEITDSYSQEQDK
ncbi:hypothetical protein CUZ56_01361 [Saezia sanguinis]|uniref:Raqprd family integrative conjugative element protein n=1 Tax=Saezia sanguinis TaxID=1965230 RepID=A0A433SFE9_9BURK|nr:RAQPRD family integrative conjugative element protein [Saezia sanguinis]RUS67416.1 hypothetical protein CUZ56_01361 [Saezia sanguinis]